MNASLLWLSAGGAVFTVIAVIAAVFFWRREKRRRARVFMQRYGGNLDAILAAVGPDERDVLIRIRRTHGDEGAAIRLRRVDKDLPFEVLLAAVRTLP